MKSTVRATMHGAISIVNAIATGNGSALGISLKVIAEVALEKGHGIKFAANQKDKLITNVIRNSIPNNIINKNSIYVNIVSEIPIGFGLKSSSAVTNAVALACSKLVSEKIDDHAVLEAAVRASVDTKVTITGAYDDSTACYFGGFVVTDNYAHKLIRRDKAPDNIYAIIFIPSIRDRINIDKLSIMSDLFSEAFKLAKSRDYWKAMKLNGVICSSVFSKEYMPLLEALEKGALAASISGNGPSIAAVTHKDQIEDIKSVFIKFNGRVLVSKVNNQKASVEKIIG
jgi:shikimate kinase